MSDCKRRKGESFEQFFRRVKQGWKLSGKILQVRKIKVFVPKKSKNMRKERKVTHTKMQAKKAYLQKIGRLPQDDRNRGRGGRKR